MFAVFQNFNNPYTNTNVIWATRKGYDKFKTAIARKDDAVNWWNKVSRNRKEAIEHDGKLGYLFMLGLPACNVGKNTETYSGWRHAYATMKIG